MPAGALAAACAYVAWGLFPLYLKQLASVPALETVLHRAWWSMVLMVAVLGVLAARGRLGAFGAALRRPRTIAIFTASALLISANWVLYAWAVLAGRVVDASLGYFINPLVNVVLGVAVLGERPRAGQWAAVAVAAAGVAWLAVGTAHVPWIALGLAASFGTYGLLRKIAPLGAVEGLALETMLLGPVVGAALAWMAWRGIGHFGGFGVLESLGLPAAGDARTDALLVLGGPLTTVPLLLFAYGARRVTLATLGLLQYLGPTLQFLLGVYVYGEPFGTTRAIGFIAIWAALAIYSAEGLVAMRRARPAVAAG